MILKDAIEIYYILCKFSKKTSNEVQWFISKNINALREDLKCLEKQEKDLIDITANFYKELEEFKNSDTIIPNEELDKKSKILKEKYKEDFDKEEIETKKYQEFLKNNNSTYIPYIIKYNLIPDDTFEHEEYQLLVKHKLIVE